MKTLKQILEVYSPKSADEKRFVNKHITIKHADRNGNDDDVFTASNVKTIDRAKTKKGYDTKSSEAVYEGVVGKMLTDKGAKQLMAAPKGKKSYFKNTVKTDKGTETEHGYYDDQGNRHVTHKVAKEEVEGTKAPKLTVKKSYNADGEPEHHVYHNGKLVKKFSNALSANTYIAKQQKMQKEDIEYDVMLIDEARASAAYQFTHKPGDAESEKKLADLKAQHKGSGNRVVLKGRLGKDNPNAQKYKDAAKANKGRGYGAHAYQTIKKSDAAHHDVYVYKKATEEVEQIDELSKETLSSYLKQRGSMVSPRSKNNKGNENMFRAATKLSKKVAKEEVEQIDELTKSTLASYASKASKSAAGLATTAMHHKNAAAAWDNDNGRSASKRHANKMSKQFTQYSTDATNKQIKRQKGVDSALKRLAKEEIEVNEALKVSHGAGAWIKDFQDSDNPKFAGKSKEQRKQQALAAFYAAKRAGKE